MPPTNPRQPTSRTPMSFRALAEKYPAEETRTNVHEYPQDSPARAPRREIPCSRNENNRTRINIKKCRQSPKRPFPLPARNIVGPLWLKTVTCGLFLRHFVPPRRAREIPTVTPFPRNDRLLGRVGRFIRINIIKPSAHTYRLVIASEAWQSRGNEMPPTRPRQPTCSRWFTAEKSPAEETRTSVYELPQTLARAGSAPRGGSPPAEVPCCKKRFARFCRENRFSIYVIAFLRREPLISVSCGYTYSAFTEACFRDRSRFLSLPKPFTSVPATAENRVVFYKTKKTG